MDKEKRSTKEKILEEALTLFSERDYDGTGVDLIAAKVGIKGPSLYKHFKDKEDILNSILDATEARYIEMFGSMEKIGKIPENMEEFIQLNLKRISFTVTDPMVRKIRIFLTKEQFRNARLAEITSRHLFHDLHKINEEINKEMQKKKLLKNGISEMISLELTGAISLLIVKADRELEYRGEILADTEKYLRYFCEIHGKNIRNK